CYGVSLCCTLSLHDALPIYDDVVPLSEEERKAWASLPFNEKKFKKDFGIPKVTGETGYTTLERTWARPTFEINGLLSGFTGEGRSEEHTSELQSRVDLVCRL